MTPTICRDEALRIGGAIALTMLKRPGWGGSISWRDGGFHAVLTTPDRAQVGKAGRMFGGDADTPSAALQVAFAASEGHTTNAVRLDPQPVAAGGCRCGCAACPG